MITDSEITHGSDKDDGRVWRHAAAELKVTATAD